MSDILLDDTKRFSLEVLPGTLDILEEQLVKGGPGSGHHGHSGRPGKVGGSLPSDEPDIFIGVPADIVEPGTPTTQMHDFKQPSGAPIRGERAIAADDPIIPDRVYHMTTSLSGVRESNQISARGEGGLGGDKKDQIVSMTIDRATAERLATDMRLVSRVARDFVDSSPVFVFDEETKQSHYEDPRTGERMSKEEHSVWAQGVLDRLNELDTQTPDWDFRASSPLQLETYNFSDLLRAYMIARSSKANVPNPLFYGDIKDYARIDPDNVGYISIPKQNLNTGALLMDFDVGKSYGLDEIRLYGDVPLDGAEFIE